MTLKILAIASAVTAVSLTSYGQGTFVYDQQSSTGPVLEGSGFAINFSQPVGQSFTPSLNAVGFVSLNLLTGPAPGGNSVEVLLHSGSITGPTIGTSEAVLLPVNFNGFATFVFDTPPTVMPGMQYFFQPVIQSGTDTVGVTTSSLYNYAGGDAIYQGNPVSGSDLWFQEGIIVTEPSAYAVMLLGAGIFLWSRYRR